MPWHWRGEGSLAASREYWGRARFGFEFPLLTNGDFFRNAGHLKGEKGLDNFYMPPCTLTIFHVCIST